MFLFSAGLYVHIPFCASKCQYCSFYSVAANTKSIQRYYQALCSQIESSVKLEPWASLPYASIFLGGGTPSILPTAMLCDLLSRLKHHVQVQKNAEISIEVNPATIDFEGFKALRKAGFNRVSIGCQALTDQALYQLGRVHSAQDAIACFHAARRAGIANISLDFMYGLPGQTALQWQQTLEQIDQLQPEHLSLYELTLEEGTPLMDAAEKGTLQLPSEEVILECMALMDQFCATTPYKRYEISNYARQGAQCRHNINYWHNGAYLGLGPSAVSSYKGRRWTGKANVASYCKRAEQGQSLWDAEEPLDHETYFRETVMIGLRLIEGVDTEALYRRFGIDVRSYYGKTLTRLIDQNLIELHDAWLRLSKTGLPLANMVMAEFV